MYNRKHPQISPLGELLGRWTFTTGRRKEALRANIGLDFVPFFVSQNDLGVPSFPSLTPCISFFSPRRRCSSQPRQYKKDYDLHKSEGSMIPFKRGEEGDKKRKTQKKDFRRRRRSGARPHFRVSSYSVRCKRRAIYLLTTKKSYFVLHRGGFSGEHFPAPFFCQLLLLLLLLVRYI